MMTTGEAEKPKEEIMQWGDSNNTARGTSGEIAQERRHGQVKHQREDNEEEGESSPTASSGVHDAPTTPLEEGNSPIAPPTQRSTPTVSSIIIMQLLQARNGGQRGNLRGHLQRKTHS